MRLRILDNFQNIDGLEFAVDAAKEEGEHAYTMTFIPWILLAGLITLSAACGLAAGLALDSLKVPSFRSGRMLDAIRLTADLGVALDKEVFEEASSWNGEKLNKAADGVRFQYEPMRLDKGRHSMGVRLRQVQPPEGNREHGHCATTNG
ncbi:hypothetical protein FZEAL_10031 [Fusarium zealandicum]|uniref:Uncharacterized protein n=1 Tax=Fusarium zealandicum TaxID=1053134 RepID=A0A8H4U6F8_9HYPO|nr:hypothetical protein FZEAL_10031 [Fusarium zealandicum]